ncbi:RES family NAD+ phosphorylase [Rhizobium sp. C1]|uniref:RES family NAD+ phosphorylase n=1 Tax=Rhizobium sp. C1 TaxID=1349799 RepID=UPI001E2FF218|nr:RES family NAD+ phosphorylase [Rhizobium sp. C1]MCD2178361.1 RES family NAD+ phosphorylase [Rhizobium sp. C1]
MPHDEPRPRFCAISGRFYRAVLVERIGNVLDPPAPQSAGRYHRHGQPALYMSPEPEWAMRAISGYMREDGKARVLIPVRVSEAFVLDQHDEALCDRLGIDRMQSNVSWRTALEAGGEPPSWRTADLARAAGADGLIDPSRNIPGGWHLDLFRWNDLGGPRVEVVGDPVEIRLSANGGKWEL